MAARTRSKKRNGKPFTVKNTIDRDIEVTPDEVRVFAKHIEVRLNRNPEISVTISEIGKDGEVYLGINGDGDPVEVSTVYTLRDMLSEAITQAEQRGIFNR